MPSWAIQLIVAALPELSQLILAVLQAIAQGGGTPSPSQAAQLASLLKLHGAIGAVVVPHLSVTADA